MKKNFWIAFIFFGLFPFSSIPVFAADIVINEFLANQPSGQNEWVEFYNPDHLDLSNYWIDDDLDFTSDAGNSSKKRLSLLDSSNPDFPVFTLSSSIFNDSCSSTCDYVVLFSEEGITADQYQYTPEQIKQEGKSIGRSPDASGNWVVLATITKGSPNSPAEPTPTPSPLPTPTPTKTPTPTPTSKPTSTSKPTPTSSRQIAVNAVSVPPSTNSLDGKQAIGKDVLPTSVLGESSQSSSQPSSIAKDHSAGSSGKVLGASQNNLSKILIGLGVILLAACSILAFRKLKMKN